MLRALLSPNEKAAAEALAKRDGRSLSELVRHLIVERARRELHAGSCPEATVEAAMAALGGGGIDAQLAALDQLATLQRSMAALIEATRAALLSARGGQ